MLLKCKQLLEQTQICFWALLEL